jgi:mono/diheme cytochrome c family protein
MLLTALALVTQACATDDDETTDDDGADGEPEAEITYREHVAPIFAANCVSCHTEGAIAPFSLDSYEGAAAVAQVAKSAVESRTMPPWSVDNSGECRTYADARWLTDEEIDIVSRWVDAGMPEGEGEIAAPADDEPDSVLSGETITVAMASEYTAKGGGTDDYRCFDIEMPTDGDVFVTGFEVLPGNSSVVHHVVVWSYDPAATDFSGVANADVVAQKDGADGQPGWDCGGTGGGISTSGLPAIWTPGTPVTLFPEGTGLRVAQGHRLMFEMHYSVAGEAAPDLTTAQLQITDSVEKEAKLVLVDGLIVSLFSGQPHIIPPGESAHEFVWQADAAMLATMGDGPMTVPGPVPEALDIYGIFPHMHTKGASLHAEVLGGDSPTCAADLPKWDFGWQQVFFYDEPLRFTGDQTLEVTCVFDTSTATEPTMPGFETKNEMCSFGVYVVQP